MSPTGDPPRIEWPNIWTSYPVVQPMGCICPPTSEKTCENPMCPRKPIKASASGHTKLTP